MSCFVIDWCKCDGWHQVKYVREVGRTDWKEKVEERLLTCWLNLQEMYEMGLLEDA